MPYWQKILTIICVGIVTIILANNSTMSQASEPKKVDLESPRLEKTTYTVVTADSLKTNTSSYSHSVNGRLNPIEIGILSAQVAGRITYVSPRFKDGTFVKMGEVLAKVDDAKNHNEIVKTKKEVARAELALNTEIARAEIILSEREELLSDKSTESSFARREYHISFAKADLEAANSELKEATRRLKQTIIKAPFDAIIKNKNIAVGNHVDVGASLAELYPTSNALLVVPIHTSVSREISKSSDLKLQISHNGHTRNLPQEYLISSKFADSSYEVILHNIQIPDPYNLKNNPEYNTIPIGTFLEAEITGIKAHKSFTIPKIAVFDNHIVRINSSQKSEFVPVEIKREEYQNFIVDGKITDLDKIIVSPIKDLEEGIIIRMENKK